MNKQTTNKLVPKLRFPEFLNAEGWETDELGDQTIKIGSGITPKGGEENYKKKGRPFVRSQNVGWGELLLDDVAFIDDNIHSTFSATEIKENDVLLNITGASIGRCTIADLRIKGGNVNQHVCIIRTKKNLNPFFLCQFLMSQGGQNQIDSFQAGGNRQGLNFVQIRSFLVPLPQLYDEQEKIADCLTSIDDLITAQNQKLGNLKTHKKGLMQQLFPADGEMMPKLRFPEFMDGENWKKKKLSAVAELTSSKRVHLSDYVSIGIPFFRGKEISLLKKQEMPEDILYISEEQYKEIKEKYGVPDIGDILITAVGTLGNVYCVQNTDKFYFKDGNLIWMKNISEYSRFLELLFDVNSRDVLASAIGSSQKALTMVELNKLEFKFPQKPEQQKIADCLFSINDLIAVQTQKIEMLKTHKQALMQQLFPYFNE